MAEPWKVVGSHIARPDRSAKQAGEVPRIVVVVNRNLRGGRVDLIEVSEAEALRLARDLIANVMTMRSETL